MAEHSVVEICRELIRFDTSNFGNGDAKGERNAAEFIAERLVAACLDPMLLERSAGRGNVLARIAGEHQDLPALLVQGHLDVVPAEAADWQLPPFAAELRDGYLWGRGATDMKDFCAIVIAAVAEFARTGRRPRRDIVLAFVADEEDRGVDGAEWLVAEHADLFEGCAAAISESGGFSHHVAGRRLYPIATAERGTAHLRLTARGRAGHGSRRNDQNAVTALVRALATLSNHEWPVRLTPTVRMFFQRAAELLGVPIDLSTADGVDAALAAIGDAAPLVENTVRNSVTPTMLRAGYKVNVIPSEAEAEVDIRVLPGTEDALMSTVDDLLGDAVRREFVAHQPPVQAPADSSWFTAMEHAIRAADPSATVVPYCMGGGTDAKAFSRLGIDCYGFSPLRLPAGFDYRAMAHGVDERVPVDGLEFGANVMYRFLSDV